MTLQDLLLTCTYITGVGLFVVVSIALKGLY